MQEALASTEDDGVDHQPELVDQVGGEKRVHELRAPDREEVLAVVALQRPNGCGYVALEQTGVSGPSSSRHVARCHRVNPAL